MLAAIRQNKPPAQALPAIPSFSQPDGSLIEHYEQAIEKVGGKVLKGLERPALAQQIAQLYPEAKQVWSGEDDLLQSTITVNEETPPPSMADLDVALIRGLLGVAENGAIWVPERSLPQRVIAFINQHLIIVLEASSIVWNMHQAYRTLGTDLAGFGLFIAGPSKTADIEQSLVIGAHGPRSLTVCLV